MRHRRVGIAAGAALLVLALGGCDTMNALLDDKPAGQTEAAEAMPPQVQDIAFAEQAAAAGEKEVALGELAAQRADDEAVESFARQMASDHGAANGELLAIAEQRSIDLTAASGEAAVTAAADRFEPLRGKAFDLAYLELTATDHEAVVALYEEQVAKGSDPALVAFAAEKLPTLRAHLEHARSLQEDF